MKNCVCLQNHPESFALCISRDPLPCYAPAHQPTRRNWTVLASFCKLAWVAFRLVGWCAGSHKLVLARHQTCLELSNFVALVDVRGHLKNCRRLKTRKNWTPNTSRRNAHCWNPSSFVASVDLRRTLRSPERQHNRKCQHIFLMCCHRFINIAEIRASMRLFACYCFNIKMQWKKEIYCIKIIRTFNFFTVQIFKHIHFWKSNIFTKLIFICCIGYLWLIIHFRLKAHTTYNL